MWEFSLWKMIIFTANKVMKEDFSVLCFEKNKREVICSKLMRVELILSLGRVCSVIEAVWVSESWNSKFCACSFSC